MFNRLRSVVSGAVEGMDSPRIVERAPNSLPHKYKYSRPAFLNLSEDALVASKEKKFRPVLSSSSSNPLPHNSGYAECVNAGKSVLNEDMAQVYRASMKCRRREPNKNVTIDYTYYGIFDGHAGYGAAMEASKQLHHIIHLKLVDSLDTIVALEQGEIKNSTIDVQALIVGCLETSFQEMDNVIKESRKYHYNPGGCTAIVALFILGHLYVANAGDCRAAIVDGTTCIEMSTDFSPSFDKTRIYRKAEENQKLLGEKYMVREFLDSHTRNDLGKTVLYKDPQMKGWSYKELVMEDLKLPLIAGAGRRSRIMGTIGVARGFGDFDLLSNHYRIPIKPFLSCLPEINVSKVDLMQTNSAVLVMGSDGLWDAVDNALVAQICNTTKDTLTDRNINITKAMNLVAVARGRKDHQTNMWVSQKASNASLDDISVFVIYMQPLGNVHGISIEEQTIVPQEEDEDEDSLLVRLQPVEISDTESGSSTAGNVSDDHSDGNPECDNIDEEGSETMDFVLKLAEENDDAILGE